MSETSPSTPLDGGEFSIRLLKHEREMRALIGASIPGCAEVDDILQETSVAMWKKIADYDRSRPFRPWALAFTRMQVLAWLEKQGRQRRGLSKKSIDQLTDRFLADGEVTDLYRTHDDRHIALEHCLTLLKDNERALLRDRYKTGYAITEIAERSQPKRSLDSLYKQFSRLHQRLLTCVERRLEA